MNGKLDRCYFNGSGSSFFENCEKLLKIADLIGYILYNPDSQNT